MRRHAAAAEEQRSHLALSLVIAELLLRNMALPILSPVSRYPIRPGIAELPCPPPSRRFYGFYGFYGFYRQSVETTAGHGSYGQP